MKNAMTSRTFAATLALLSGLTAAATPPPPPAAGTVAGSGGQASGALDAPVLQADLTFETTRVLARPFQLEDAGLMAKVCSELEDQALTQDACAHDILFSMVAANERRGAKTTFPLTTIWYGLFLKESGALAGVLTFSNVPTYPHFQEHPVVAKATGGEATVIGYGLLKAHRSKGLMSEVLPPAMAFANARLGLPHLFADPAEDNVASVKVLKKAGFKLIHRAEAGKAGAAARLFYEYGAPAAKGAGPAAAQAKSGDVCCCVIL